MISDKTLMRISLAVAATGIAALYVLVVVTEPVKAQISELKPGQNVLVSGVVSDYRESNGNIFFTLENSSTIKVVMFAPDARTPQIKNNDSITVSGKVQYYRNYLELIARRIVK